MQPTRNQGAMRVQRHRSVLGSTVPVGRQGAGERRSLSRSRMLEGMAWIHISLAQKHDWPWQSAWKIVGPKA